MDLLEKMSTYVRVVEAGSLSAAAKQIRLSPAAVSRQIVTLESELGVTLLARTTRRMAVTEAGQRYYERCLRVLREVDEAQALGRRSQADGFLQVTAPISFGLGLVAPLMPGFRRKHPGVRLELRLEDRLLDLALEGMDVAIRVAGLTPESASLIAHPLVTFRRVLVAAPEYLKRKGEPKTPEALMKHDLLGHPVEPWALVGPDRSARTRGDVVFSCNSLQTVREVALSGAGVALLPEWLVAQDERRRALQRVLPDWQTTPIPVNAIHRVEQRGAPRIRALIDFLRLAYSEESGFVVR